MEGTRLRRAAPICAGPTARRQCGSVTDCRARSQRTAVRYSRSQGDLRSGSRSFRQAQEARARFLSRGSSRSASDSSPRTRESWSERRKTASSISISWEWTAETCTPCTPTASRAASAWPLLPTESTSHFGPRASISRRWLSPEARPARSRALLSSQRACCSSGAMTADHSTSKGNSAGVPPSLIAWTLQRVSETCGNAWPRKIRRESLQPAQFASRPTASPTRTHTRERLLLTSMLLKVSTDVTPERWQELKQLVGSALAVPEAEREAFVRGRSGQDSELCGQALSLLSSRNLAEGFLSAPALEAAGSILDSVIEERHTPVPA